MADMRSSLVMPHIGTNVPIMSRDFCRLYLGKMMAYLEHMTKSFRSALLDALETGDASLRQVADGAGVSYEQLKKICQRETASTNVDDAVKIAGFFGVSLDEFLGNDLVSTRSEIVHLYNQLSEAEREILLDAARGRRANHLENLPKSLEDDG
jgi:transcriptional regulator with XRE-family HTH domain